MTRSANSPGTSSTTTSSPCIRWRRARAALVSRAPISSSNALANEATPCSSSTRLTSSRSTPTSASASRVRWADVEVGVDGASDGAVVEERLDRLLGHRVHRVGADELVDVGRVGVGRVLRGRRRPQRSLHPCATRDERLPPRPLEGDERTAGRPPGPGPPRPGPRSARAALVPISSRRRSTSVSTREMKKLATLEMRLRSPSAASRPAR